MIGGWDPEDVHASDVARVLSELRDARNIVVRINSPGGDAFEGVAIHNLLTAHPADIEVRIDGMALSAASVIAMAGDKIMMARNAMMMIHDPWTFAAGDSKRLREEADRLDKVAGAIASTYAARTGSTADEARATMANETWLTAEEALSQGFCTEIVEPKQPPVPADGATSARWRATLNMYRRPEIAGHLIACAARTDKETPMTVKLIQALGLPEQATEADALTAVAKLSARGTLASEVEILTEASGPAALGVVRAWREGAARGAELATENARLQTEAHGRDFAAAIADGKSARKLTPATAAHFEARFQAAIKDGRAASLVEELKSFLAVAPQIVPTAGTPAEPPPAGAGVGAVLTHDGKAFDQLAPIEKHNLWRDQPELYAAMRDQARLGG